MLLFFLMDTYIFFRMCDLFDQTIRYAARELGYTYDTKEGNAAFAFFKAVRDLPKNAEEIPAL